MSARPNWISEEEAAKLLSFQPKTLRRYAREGRVKVDYTRVNYRTYEYDLNSINQYKLSRSTITR